MVSSGPARVNLPCVLGVRLVFGAKLGTLLIELRGLVSERLVGEVGLSSPETRLLRVGETGFVSPPWGSVPDCRHGHGQI